MFMNEDERWMKLAYGEAFLAKKEDEVPVGAAIVKDGVLLASAHNQREKKLDISSHAEIEAIRKAAKKIGTWNLIGATIYVTLEPCLMCSGAIMQSRLSRIVFAAKDPSKGAIVSKYCVFDDPKAETHPLISVGVLEEACQSLLTSFFENKRSSEKI